MKDKVILVDADGVLLDWIYSFELWMKRHGYTEVTKDSYSISERYNLNDENEGYRLAKMFNESAWIRKLPPYLDAIKYVKKLHTDHGYVFHCISSISDDEYSQHLRTKNIRELFGDTVFERYTYFDTGACKKEALEFYRDSGCYFIEDKFENAIIGVEYGLKSILMTNHINKKHPDFEKYCESQASQASKAYQARNWKDIYELITNP